MFSIELELETIFDFPVVTLSKIAWFSKKFEPKNFK